MADNNANEYSTVTLSLDDGTECECAIVRIFPAGDNNYIALLLLKVKLPATMKCIFTDIQKKTMVNRFLKTSNQMKNTKLLLTHLTKC